MSLTINGAIRCNLTFTQSGTFLGQSGFGLAHAPGGFFTQANMDSVAGLLVTAITDHSVDQALADVVQITTMLSHDYDNPTLSDLESTVSVLGSEAGDPLPSMVSVITSFRTGLSGRANRGRAYWPGYTEASADGDTFNPTSQTNLQGMWEQFAADVFGAFTPVTLGVISLTNATVHSVTSINVEGSFATQRRRNERRR